MGQGSRAGAYMQEDSDALTKDVYEKITLTLKTMSVILETNTD